MSKQLHIGQGFSLPLDAVTRRLAFVGTVGSGKTYGATKLAEEMHDAGAQIVVLDPVGVWYGLRLLADGKSPGIPIKVFGGLNGDIPLEATGGALVADFIADTGASVIIDVSQFEYDTDKAKFATDFASRFFFRKKAKPSAVHLFLEECQEFVPQNPERGEERMLHAFNRIWKIGRNFGIGGSLISQRPQEVNKKALNLTQCLFAFQTLGTHERKAIESWIQDKALDLDIANDLPKLKVGQPHVWAPAWLGISEGIKIAEKRTFNASSTPTVGDAGKRVVLAPIDLDRLSKEMLATVERAKESDPAILKKRIADLTRQVQTLQLPGRKPAGNESEMKALVERTEREMARYQRDTKAFIENYRAGVQKAAAGAITAITSAGKILQELNGIQPKAPEMVVMKALKSETHQPVRAPMISTPLSENGELPIGERRILIAICQYGKIRRQQLTVLTSYTRSSRNTYLQKLGAKGFIEMRGGEIWPTNAGIGALGSGYEPLPTGQELIDYWKKRLPTGEAKIFSVLVEQYPESIDRERLGELTEYTRSSRNTYLQKLGAKELIEVSGQTVKASPRLFE